MKNKGLLFSIAVAIQLLILLYVPAQRIYTRATGKTVLLNILPYDPYSPFTGYYANLNYEVAVAERYKEFKNKQLANQHWEGDSVYAILQKRSDGTWGPDYLSIKLPRQLPDNQIALKGKYIYRIDFGIERFYIPENKRDEIESVLRTHPEKAKAEVKVDSYGNTALMRLIIGDRVYDY